MCVQRNSQPISPRSGSPTHSKRIDGLHNPKLSQKIILRSPKGRPQNLRNEAVFGLRWSNVEQRGATWSNSLFSAAYAIYDDTFNATWSTTRFHFGITYSGSLGRSELVPLCVQSRIGLWCTEQMTVWSDEHFRELRSANFESARREIQKLPCQLKVVKTRWYRYINGISALEGNAGNSRYFTAVEGLF
jgi:hypothetical protein